MRFSAATGAGLFGLVVAVVAWPRLAAGQAERDFVFTDVEGHLVLRFAGAQPEGLDADQMEEIINVSLSTMVHDRLRADAVFEAEPVDPPWAAEMAASIRTHVIETGPELSAIEVECRSSSCRLVLEHASRGSVSEHQALMEVVQGVMQAFIAANPASFYPVFLLAAYEQEAGIPNIKAFLRRAAPREL